MNVKAVIPVKAALHTNRRAARPAVWRAGIQCRQRRWTPASAGVTAFLVLFSVGLLRAADSLADWVAHIENPDMQQKILNLILPGQVGPVSTSIEDPKSGRRLFTKGGFWVRLGGDGIWHDPKTPGYVPFAAFTILSYQTLEKGPMSATSYVLSGNPPKASTLSAGYSAHERVHLVVLPKLKKSFLLLLGAPARSYDASQWTATLLPLGPTGFQERPRAAWMSPVSARKFQLGFDELGGKTELLLMRAERAGDIRYKAYRWSGDRFEEDGFASESRIKNLPADVWKYGAAY